MTKQKLCLNGNCALSDKCGRFDENGDNAVGDYGKFLSDKSGKCLGFTDIKLNLKNNK